MFTKATIQFLDGLTSHNEKAWFDAHRAEYDDHVVEPARAFVSQLGEKLRKVAKTIQYEPKIGGSIMRINRDIRFSKDKSPYKTHLDMFFWQGGEKGWDRPGFFFRLRPETLLLGTGMHHFEKEPLERFRKAVLDEKTGSALSRAIAQLNKAGYEVGGSYYKKVPRGLPADHPRAELLKHDGLHCGVENPIPKELFTPRFADYCFERFKAMTPLYDWLTNAMSR